MNMMKHPDERHRSQVDGPITSGSYEVVMRLSVEDSVLLWRAAAARAFTCMECTDLDVEDMFGPREDPSVADCLAMLIGPHDLDGCRFDAFSIVPVAAADEQATGQAGSRRPRSSRMSHLMRLESGDNGDSARRKPATRP
tara:strand:- start:4525 stop:4944 length:420 start_codon:yes stop_codon:yes gene_type:complete